MLRLSFFEVAVPVLLISITILLLVILFRRIRQRWSRGEPQTAHFALLYSIEKQPISGEIEIYYELQIPKEIEIWLLDAQMGDKVKIDSRLAKVGGNKIRFNTQTVDNGRYFYELRSDNQRTSKAIYIENIK